MYYNKIVTHNEENIYDKIYPKYQNKSNSQHHYAVCSMQKTAGNKKHFKIYEKAINFFEGTTTTEKPYGICMKYKDEQDITR